MPEAIFTMPLGKYFFSSEAEFMDKIQKFGKQQGIMDGAFVAMEYSRSHGSVHVKLTWDEPPSYLRI